jgi:hypothetical protein
MTPPPVGTDSTGVKLRLTEEQVSVIWPGLNYIICQFLTRQDTGQAVTSYPFRIQPLPPGSDSGTFSAAMMDRFQKLWSKIQPIKTTGGDLQLDEFELRAAIFAARTSVKLERRDVQKTQKQGAKTKRRMAGAKRALNKQVRKKEEVVAFLETALKRASRLLTSEIGAEEFKTQSKEWQSHLLWIEYHLTYFKPFRTTELSITKLHRGWVEILVGIAEKAIAELGYELPEPAELRAAMRQYLAYSLRGRMGEYDHIFMLRNSASSVAQMKLFDFVNERIALREAS